MYMYMLFYSMNCDTELYKSVYKCICMLFYSMNCDTELSKSVYKCICMLFYSMKRVLLRD